MTLSTASPTPSLNPPLDARISILGNEVTQRFAQTTQRWAFGTDGLARILTDLHVRRAFVVMDENALDASGKRSALSDALMVVDDVEVFTDFQPNPRCPDSAQAARRAASFGADTVIAVGGGSCLDTAKVAALAANTPGSADQLAAGRGLERARPLPLIAMATTSGTGSEATPFAAMYVPPDTSGSGVWHKVSVAHPGMRPVAVVFEPAFHEAMPAKLAACSGLDALCQSLESTWAVAATPESLSLARVGGRLVIDHLVPSVRRPEPATRFAVMIGAHLVGRAIAISKTTASHAMSYALTQRYGIPHGHAVALTVGALAAFNAEVQTHDLQHPAGVAEVRARVTAAAALLGCEPHAMPQTMREQLRALGVAKRLSDFGITRDDATALSRQADAVRLSNNPRRIDRDGIEKLLHACL